MPRTCGIARIYNHPSRDRGTLFFSLPIYHHRCLFLSLCQALVWPPCFVSLFPQLMVCSSLTYAQVPWGDGDYSHVRVFLPFGFNVWLIDPVVLGSVELGLRERPERALVIRFVSL